MINYGQDGGPMTRVQAARRCRRAARAQLIANGWLPVVGTMGAIERPDRLAVPPASRMAQHRARKALGLPAPRKGRPPGNAPAPGPVTGTMHLSERADSARVRTARYRTRLQLGLPPAKKGPPPGQRLYRRIEPRDAAHARRLAKSRRHHARKAARESGGEQPGADAANSGQAGPAQPAPAGLMGELPKASGEG